MNLPDDTATASCSGPRDGTARRHLQIGWSWLAIFGVLGLVLESMHGFKWGWYLDPPNEVRRLMWTLGHAHGTALGLVNVALGLTAWAVPGWRAAPRRVASACLLSASMLIPGGFFLGGWRIHAGDPGIGILLLPPGAALLLIALALTALAARRVD